MSAPTESPLEASVISRLTWRLVPFLFLLYIVAFLDRVNVGFAALQMQPQLGFSDRVYGLAAGIFFAGYFFFQLPSNLILQRVGARRWLPLLMIVWGLVSTSMMFVRTPREFYISRFLLGAAEAGFFPGVILYLKNWFPASAQARTVARFMTAPQLSGVVGGPISGALLALHSRGGLAGWQWLFLLEGVPAVLLGIISYFYLTGRPGEAHWLTSEQRAWLIQALAREERERPTSGGTDLFAPFTGRWTWLLCGVYFGLNTASYGIILWLPSLIHSLSASSSFEIGVLTAIPFALAAMTMVLVGLHSDRTSERRWHVAVPAFAGAAGLFAAGYSTSTFALIATISVAALAVASMNGPFWAIPNALLQGAAAASGIALINSVGNLGGFFGPYIIGFARSSTGAFRGGLLVAGATLALAGGVVLLVRLRERIPSGDEKSPGIRPR